MQSKETIEFKNKFQNDNALNIQSLIQYVNDVYWILLDYDDQKELYPKIIDFLNENLSLLDIEDIKKVANKMYFHIPENIIIKILEDEIKNQKITIDIDVLLMNKILSIDKNIILQYQLLLNKKNKIQNDILESIELKQLKYDIYSYCKRYDIKPSESYHHFIIENLHTIKDEKVRKSFFYSFLHNEDLSAEKKIKILLNKPYFYSFIYMEDIHKFINEHDEELKEMIPEILKFYLKRIEQLDSLPIPTFKNLFEGILNNEYVQLTIQNNKQINNKIIKMFKTRMDKETNEETLNFLQKLFINDSELGSKVVNISKDFFKIIKQPVIRKKKNLIMKEPFFDYIIDKNIYKFAKSLENIWRKNIDFQNNKEKNQLAYLIFDNFHKNTNNETIEKFQDFHKIGYAIFKNLKKEFEDDLRDESKEMLEKIELNLKLEKSLDKNNLQKIYKKI